MRLRKICDTLPSSVSSSGTCGLLSKTSATFSFLRSGRSMPRKAAKVSSTLNVTGRKPTLPASILDRSRRSSTISVSVSALFLTKPSCFSCSGVRSPSSRSRRSLDSPKMELSGVRNSWLTLAMRCDFTCGGAAERVALLVELRVESDHATRRLLELAIEAHQLLVAAQELALLPFGVAVQGGELAHHRRRLAERAPVVLGDEAPHQQQLVAFHGHGAKREGAVLVLPKESDLPDRGLGAVRSITARRGAIRGAARDQESLDLGAAPRSREADQHLPDVGAEDALGARVHPGDATVAVTTQRHFATQRLRRRRPRASHSLMLVRCWIRHDARSAAPTALREPCHEGARGPSARITPPSPAVAAFAPQPLRPGRSGP